MVVPQILLESSSGLLAIYCRTQVVSHWMVQIFTNSSSVTSQVQRCPSHLSNMSHKYLSFEVPHTKAVQLTWMVVGGLTFLTLGQASLWTDISKSRSGVQKSCTLSHFAPRTHCTFTHTSVVHVLVICKLWERKKRYRVQVQMLLEILVDRNCNRFFLLALMVVLENPKRLSTPLWAFWFCYDFRGTTPCYRILVLGPFKPVWSDCSRESPFERLSTNWMASLIYPVHEHKSVCFPRNCCLMQFEIINELKIKILWHRC